MCSKILLIALSAVVFCSCSTAYKSGQTPDDVYYSPSRVIEDNPNKYKEDDYMTVNSENHTIHMGIRDKRFRTLNDEYDYSYNNSPYGYCSCSCNNYGYYYNPYYSTWPVYYPTITYTSKYNTTPRMVNLNSYTGYANAGSTQSAKGGNGTNWMKGYHTYNNSNHGSGVGNAFRQIINPSSNNSSNHNNNNTRTYTPSSPGNNNSGNSSSGSNNSGNSVSRPKRGG